MHLCLSKAASIDVSESNGKVASIHQLAMVKHMDGNDEMSFMTNGITADNTAPVLK